MITVADPQILWNDGFYPLVDVDDPGRLVLEAEVPGRAERAATTASAGSSTCSAACSARPTRPCSTRPASPRPRTSCTPATTATGDRKGEWFQLYSIGFGGIPGRPLGDGPDGHSLWPSFVNIPCEYLESYYPLRIEKWETVADTGGAGLHRGGNGVDVAYRFLESRARSPSTTTAGSPTRGASTAASRARAARKWVERADGTTRGAAQQVPRRAGRARRRAALRHLGRRRLGRPARARPGAGRRWRCGAGWSRAEGAAPLRRRASTEDGARRRGGHRDAARPDARRPARPSCRSSTWARRSRSSWQLRGGDRPAGAEAAGLGRGEPAPHGTAFSGRVGWGSRPAVVVIDLVRAYTDPAGPFAPARRRPGGGGDAGAGRGGPGARAPGGVDRRPLRARARRRRAVRAQGAGAGLLRRGRPRRLGRARRCSRTAGEAVVVKQYASAFFGTSLASTLHAAGRGHRRARRGLDVGLRAGHRDGRAQHRLPAAGGAGRLRRPDAGAARDQPRRPRRQVRRRRRPAPGRALAHL